MIYGSNQGLRQMSLIKNVYFTMIVRVLILRLQWISQCIETLHESFVSSKLLGSTNLGASRQLYINWAVLSKRREQVSQRHLFKELGCCIVKKCFQRIRRNDIFFEKCVLVFNYGENQTLIFFHINWYSNAQTNWSIPTRLTYINVTITIL